MNKASTLDLTCKTTVANISACVELTPGMHPGCTELSYALTRTNFRKAGTNALPAAPRFQISGSHVLVGWKPTSFGNQPSTAMVRAEVAQYIPVSTLPETLASRAVLIAGPGYLMLISHEEAKALAAARPELSLESSRNLTFDTSTEALPRVKALGFKRYKIGILQEKGIRFFDLGGNIWDAAGMKMGDDISVIRFADGVRISKAIPGQRTFKLGSTTAQSGNVYEFKRIYESMFDGLIEDAARVAVAKDALYILADKIKLSAFGLTSKSLFVGTLNVKDGEIEVKKPSAIINASIYPLRLDDSRIQVQGDWLARYGFVPGARFTVEPHPLIRGRVLVRLDSEGESVVTQHSRPGSSKLYIPTKMVRHFTSENVRVWGTVEGLHVQQNFATSWHKADEKLAA